MDPTESEVEGKVILDRKVGNLLLAGNLNRGQADEKGAPLEPSAGPVEVPET